MLNNDNDDDCSDDADDGDDEYDADDDDDDADDDDDDNDDLFFSLQLSPRDLLHQRLQARSSWERLEQWTYLFDQGDSLNIHNASYKTACYVSLLPFCVHWFSRIEFETNQLYLKLLDESFPITLD